LVNSIYEEKIHSIEIARCKESIESTLNGLCFNEYEKIEIKNLDTDSLKKTCSVAIYFKDDKSATLNATLFDAAENYQKSWEINFQGCFRLYLSTEDENLVYENPGGVFPDHFTSIQINDICYSILSSLPFHDGCDLLYNFSQSLLDNHTKKQEEDRKEYFKTNEFKKYLETDEFRDFLKKYEPPGYFDEYKKESEHRNHSYRDSLKAKYQVTKNLDDLHEKDLWELYRDSRSYYYEKK